MVRQQEEELRVAKRGYEAAKKERNHAEEARWANVVGNILKDRGEYREALRWLHRDFEVSEVHLALKQLFPSCQSLGEVYFCLQKFEEALKYQKMHLELARDSDDLKEQQRASTQLGRTYHEMFQRSNDHHAMRNAKKYFKSAMELVLTLRESSSCQKSSFFLKEFIDAHNNIGMLEMDLDNLEEAEKVLLQGLRMCDDEEVSENYAGRSRLHNNLGSVYIQLREWGRAREHIQKDISICRSIDHSQGEAKGYINLGELYYRVQKYDEARRCYQKALVIAKRLEDEEALADQIKENIKTVDDAELVLEELKKDEQKFKKLMRTTCDARGTSNERKCLLEQITCLDGLIEKASQISAWPKHLDFAKRKKRVATELCDKEKLGDSFLAIGESYQNLRKFSKARKWYMKCWNEYNSIGNLEGQALAKINIGHVLDSSGDWPGAFQAYEEGHRIAVQGDLLPTKKVALENMHYCQMIRFDNVEEARKLQDDIQELEHLLKKEDVNHRNDYCPETETEGENSSDSLPGVSSSPHISEAATNAPNHVDVGDFDEDVPLVSLIRQSKSSSKIKLPQLDCHGKKVRMSGNLEEASFGRLVNSIDDQQPISRKRVRVVISDDEADEPNDMDRPRRRIQRCPIKNEATSCRENTKDEPTGSNEVQDASHPCASKDVLSSSTPLHNEESACSTKSKSPIFASDNGREFGSSSAVEMTISSKSAASGSKLGGSHVPDSPMQCWNGGGFNMSEDGCCQVIKFKVGNEVIDVDISSCAHGVNLNIDCVKVEVACAYYLQLFKAKRSKGLLPVIGHLKCYGKALGSSEPIEDGKPFLCRKGLIEGVITGWISKRLMKLYVDYCEELQVEPNKKLLKRLYNLEVSEDEVIVSDCGLQDLSISPFLKALQAHRTVAVLDISHNLLGNETMEKLQEIFASSSQKYGGLTLDLHCNRFGPTALFQICECPVLFNRLEVLNLSENRLTDACSSYLSTILENCKALYSLSIEQCSITSRTVQKVADALHDGSVLSHLSIGKNNPISGIAMVNLLTKLASLKRFSELSLTGIRLNRAMVDNLCRLVETSNMSGLFLGGTCVGVDGAVRLTEALSHAQELGKLDFSCCGLTSHDFPKICANFAIIGGIVELNLGGNPIGQEGCDALRSLLMDPQCCLKSLILDKCQLGLAGTIQIIRALADNSSLEELYLAENVHSAEERTLEYDVIMQENMEYNQREQEVADSEDEMIKTEQPTFLGPDGSCASLSQKNLNEGCELLRGLSQAIASARNLQLLDLSNNGLSQKTVDSLFASWSSSSSRCGSMAHKHYGDKFIHFSVEGKKCCCFKPCCRTE